MVWTDLVNSCFEIVGGFAVWLNVKHIYEHKYAAGVDWRFVLAMSAWGWWNLYFYSNLNQWISFYSCWMLGLGNLVWVILYFIYRNNKKESI